MLYSENSLLLIIDIQDKLVQATKYGLETAQNAVKLAKAASVMNIPTIVTEQYPKGLGATVDDLKSVLSNEAYVFEKTAFSALKEFEIGQAIRQLQKKQVIICGIESHICVLQTACDLLSQGYEVYVIKDACASRNKAEYKCAMELLKQYGAKISCVEISLFQLLKTAKHPNFKEIQQLIK